MSLAYNSWTKSFSLFSGLLFLGFNTLAADQGQSATKLEKAIPALIQQAGIPGISAAYLESGQIHWLGEFGNAKAGSTTPVTVDTVFEAASLSKPVLAYIVLRMVERKQLTLDTPLHSIYEEPRLQQKDFARQLTPRLVLSHQSGLPNWGSTPLKFNRQPGIGFGYSGEGYVYLQNVVEKISGLSLQELAAKEVFVPLKMTNSRFTWSKNDQPLLAAGHNQSGQPVSRGIPDANAASSLHTTASDYAKFLLAWINFDGLSVQSVKTAFTPMVSLPEKNGAPIETATENPDDSILSWGLGWGLMQSNGQKLAWHWGDNGVFRAFTAIDPDKQIGIVYFANSQNGLAITKTMLEKSLGDPSPIISWLDYGQSDSPIWQGMRQGYIAESNNDLKSALKQFKKVLAAFPENQNIRARVNWIENLAKYQGNTISLPRKEMKQIAGRYDVRLITLKDNQLYYRRDGGNEHLLKPLTKSLFSVGDIYEFRLEAIRDKQGKVAKLVGHYINGRKDESLRSE